METMAQHARAAATTRTKTNVARRSRDDDERPLALRSAWTLRRNFRRPIRTRRYGTDECVLTPPPW
jgi:hypothetical protein